MELREFFLGWTRFSLIDGVIFQPPGKKGLVRIRDKVPQRRFRALIDEMIREAGPAFANAKVGPLERFVTTEGEHAGIVTIEVPTPAGPIGRHVALVAGDDWSWTIDALSEDPAESDRYRQAARRLAETSYLGLGERRQRRYEHRVADGWIALARPHAVRYLHPEHPRVRVMITVFDARPRAMTEAEQDDRSLLYDSIEEVRPSETPGRVRARNGLSGPLLKFRTSDRGQELLTARLALLDSRFIYRLHLECALEQEEAAVGELLAIGTSIVPIPPGRSPDAPQASTHWAL